jgi:hypothetical protein
MCMRYELMMELNGSWRTAKLGVGHTGGTVTTHRQIFCLTCPVFEAFSFFPLSCQLPVSNGTYTYTHTHTVSRRDKFNRRDTVSSLDRDFVLQ